MKKILILLTILYSHCCNAENLIHVYRQALVSDQTFQKIVSQQLAIQQGVPISLSNLLPNLSGVFSPTINKTEITGPGASHVNQNIQHSYDLNITLTQTIFDFAQLANLSQARSLSKQANAVINSETQALILRVAQSYFAVLHAEDNVRYNEMNKIAYAEQLKVVKQHYNVGLKTLTDVYTAQTAYESAIASFIDSQTHLEYAREDLRVITGVYYAHLSVLKNTFPFVSPKPLNIEAWVNKAKKNNWSIKAAQYAVDAAQQNVKQQMSGHLPNLQIQGFYTHNVQPLTNSSEIIPFNILQTTQWGGNFVLTIPIFQGNYVTSETRQAQYSYQATYHNLEQQVLSIANQTYQSYFGVISDISQIQADKQAILAGISALKGLRAGYAAGTQTLVDVLNQQQKLFQSYEEYARDRYAYINHLLQLKFAAGTLSPKDLKAINAFLI